MNNSSAPRPTPPNGQRPARPPANPLRRPPRPPPNPLVPRKRPGIVPPPPPPSSKKSSNQKSAAPKPHARDDDALTPLMHQKLHDLNVARAQNNGWSTPAPSGTTEFKVVTTKRQLREGLKFHVMNLSSTRKDSVALDLFDTDSFPRPVTLHRRDARLPPANRVVAKQAETEAEAATAAASKEPVDDAEAERVARIKAEKEAQRAADQAQIAPIMKTTMDGKNAGSGKQSDKKDKYTLTTSFLPQTEAQRKQSELRYEETLPWHLEDADGKQVWVGSYVAALSKGGVAFAMTDQGFRVITLDRYYKFKAKPNFRVFSLEEAEKRMGKHAKEVSRWTMKDREMQAAQKEMEEFKREYYGPARIKTESQTSRTMAKSERADDNDLDISGDEFQDDDETTAFQQDSEEKDSKARMRRDHMAANLFGEGDENEVDREEEEERRAAALEKLHGRSMKKALIKREHEFQYRSDDSDDDFDDSDSDSEEQDANATTAAESAKDDMTVAKTNNSSSSGNNNPNASPSKVKTTGTDATKKGTTQGTKRSISPNASESSDNESQRKKVKRTTAAGSADQNGATGRANSVGAGHASDGEATAGEMSDAAAGRKKAKPKRKDLAAAAAGGAPADSRSGSPVPNAAAAKVKSPTMAAANSVPSPAARSASPAAGATAAPVEESEIVEALKRFTAGISVVKLLAEFPNRVGPQGSASRSEWIKMVKRNAVFGDDKLLRLKP